MFCDYPLSIFWYLQCRPNGAVNSIVAPRPEPMSVLEPDRDATTSYGGCYAKKFDIWSFTMNLDQKTVASRDMFMAIAAFEHHQRLDNSLDQFDICLRLYDIWLQVSNDARTGIFTFEEDSVLSVNLSSLIL